MVSPRRGTRSLGWNVVATLLVVEITFGVALGAVVGLFWTVSIVQREREATERSARILASALMPMIAERREARLRVELETLVHSAGLEGVHCIHVVDASGETVASHGEEDIDISQADRPRGLGELLFSRSLVRTPIVVDGLEIASVYVMFEPPDLLGLVGPSMLIWGVVVVAVMLVSVPWTLWIMARDIIEPIGEIERYAESVAEGEYNATFERAGVGEIGRLQQALGRMAGQLEEQRQEVADSYSALSEAYLSLEAANRDIARLASIKADFVAVAAHEIRAPLATIRLYAEMLEAGEMGVLDDHSARAVEVISGAAARLGSIAADLMDSALLERGLLPIQFETVWFDEVLSAAVSDARLAARRKELDVSAAGELPEMVILGDALRLRQVLDNLLSNAIKYSPAGSTVSVDAGVDGHWVWCRVTDEGQGIDDADQDRLFTLFGRIDFGDSRQAAGLGLGLAISARIVEAHGGAISYGANEAGQGSVFTVRLPVPGPTDVASGPTAVRVVDGGGDMDA